MRFNIPTLLTVSRITLTPFFVLTFYLPTKWSSCVCAIIFFMAAVTDFLDGYLARLWKQKTLFGAFLDPIADKIIVTIAMLLISEYYHSWWSTIPIAVIITREIIVSALREWMAELGKRKNVSVILISKIKTLTQMTALILILWHPYPWIEIIGSTLLWIATILTFWSMLHYFSVSKNYFFK